MAGAAPGVQQCAQFTGVLDRQPFVQAQVRQPIGQWPVPPQLLSPKLPIADAPRLLAPEEASALFERRPDRFAASLLGGSEGTRGDSVLASRSWEQVQVSIGHFDYRRDGLGDRDDIDRG